MIREDEWLAELQRLQAGPDSEGLTTRELLVIWKCGKDTALKRLRELSDAGRIVVCYKKVLGLNGRMTTASSYKLKPKEDER